MSLAKTDERIAKMYLALGDREDLNKKVLDEMELTRKWVLKIVGDEWPLQHRHVLGQAIRIRSPYVDALSVTQVLALGSLRKRVDKEELTHGQKENYTYPILCFFLSTYVRASSAPGTGLPQATLESNARPTERGSRR